MGNDVSLGIYKGMRAYDGYVPDSPEEYKPGTILLLQDRVLLDGGVPMSLESFRPDFLYRVVVDKETIRNHPLNPPCGVKVDDDPREEIVGQRPGPRPEGQGRRTAATVCDGEGGVTTVQAPRVTRRLPASAFLQQRDPPGTGWRVAGGTLGLPGHQATRSSGSCVARRRSRAGPLAAARHGFKNPRYPD